jgi:tetratricopeptide (TPR) repeat protein
MKISPLAIFLAGLTLAGTSRAAATADKHLGLEYARRFASAIGADPTDRAKALETVSADLAEAGQFDRSRLAADDIRGWRTGSAYARLAVYLLQNGKKEEALAAVRHAEKIAASLLDWQGDRIRANLAVAYSALGQDDQAVQIATNMPKNQLEYSNRMAAFWKNVDYDEMLKKFAVAEESEDFEVQVGIVTGYIALSANPVVKSDAGKRQHCLRGAWRAAKKLPALKLGEFAAQIAEEAIRGGDLAIARTVLTEAEEPVRSITYLPGSLPTLSRYASLWARLGVENRPRAVAIMEFVDAQTPRVDPMDQPMVLARAAEAFSDLGQTAEAWARLNQAVSVASGMVNARPRALAFVEISRAIGRKQMTMPAAFVETLEVRLKGLTDPW